ncbi:MAG: TIGR00303 family protein [Candidatus Methanoperedenaceae archaeon]|nr:MAG: TIGR00303 family protein [Candidatus Methanoperedenaceae archaeon]
MWVKPDPDLSPEKPLFLCILANTQTAKIPNISAAGKSPELTDFTPAADAELVETGFAISISEPAMTPSGAPSPAVLTRASMLLTGIPCIFINSGLNVRPMIPTIDLNARPGGDIRKGHAVADAFEIYNKSRTLGEKLGKLSDLVIIGESVPGGTTTAMGVLRALGYDGKVSSSFPKNPLDIKHRVVEEGMKYSGISFGGLRKRPLNAVESLGDPMMASAAGLVDGLRTKTVLAGGTQMVSVLGIIKHLGMERDVSIATTRYVADDRSANFREMTEILGYEAFAADPGFGTSRRHGLRMYENGDVKEGVGAGGAMFAAAMMGFSQKEFREKTEEVCDSIFGI